jgi:hypothetical protein
VFRNTVFNQRRELVLEGSQKYLIRRRPDSPDGAWGEGRARPQKGP